MFQTTNQYIYLYISILSCHSTIPSSKNIEMIPSMDHALDIFIHWAPFFPSNCGTPKNIALTCFGLKKKKTWSPISPFSPNFTLKFLPAHLCSKACCPCCPCCPCCACCVCSARSWWENGDFSPGVRWPNDNWWDLISGSALDQWPFQGTEKKWSYRNS